MMEGDLGTNRSVSSRFGTRGLRVAIRELLEARELLVALVRRDLIIRYEHAALGIVWALALPVAQMGIFVLVFTRVAPLQTEVPYPLYAYAGLTLWSFFAASIRAATRSMSEQIGLVMKVYFPREVLPLAAVIVSLIDFAVTLIPLAALMLWFGVRPSWSLLGLPIVMASLVAFTAALSLVAAMANVFYRDVRHVVEVVLLVGIFATSVVYPVDRIGGVVGRLLALNPLTPMIDAYRAVLFGGALPSAGALLGAGAASLVLLLGAWALFDRVEPLAAELA